MKLYRIFVVILLCLWIFIPYQTVAARTNKRIHFPTPQPSQIHIQPTSHPIPTNTAYPTSHPIPTIEIIYLPSPTPTKIATPTATLTPEPTIEIINYTPPHPKTLTEILQPAFKWWLTTPFTYIFGLLFQWS